MGHLFGRFIPTEEYYSLVQPIVWKFNSALDPQLIQWESLQLIIKTIDGTIIYALGGITIDDLEELPDEPKRLDVAGVDLQIKHKL